MLMPYNFGINPRALSIMLLEDDSEFIELVGKHENGRSIIEEAKKISREIEELHGEKTPLRIARERHGLAGSIASQVQGDVQPITSDKIWALYHFTTYRHTASYRSPCNNFFFPFLWW